MFIWKVFIIKWLDKPISFVDWINAFFENREESIYYFLFEIIGIYLTMPFLSRLAKDEYRNTLWLTVLLYFIFNALLPNIFILFKINFNMLVSVRLGGWIIFVILGWLLSTQEVNKKCRVIIYFGAILGLIYRYVITYKLTMKNGIVYKDIWGYTTWHSILLSSAIFIFIKYLNFEKKFENKEKTKKCISQISSCSFGIYLIHMFLKYYEIELFHLNEFSWKYRTIGIVITYFLSLIVVYIIKKIPIIKYVVP